MVNVDLSEIHSSVQDSALHTIDQFMWGYQTHFRTSIRLLANRVLERVGAGEEAHALLIGSLMPTGRARHLVCVEPEDGSLSQAVFEGMAQEIEGAILIDERQNMFYGDEARMRDKPENIRRAVTREKITERLAGYDAQQGVKSFCGGVYPVEGYYVCPVLQIPTKLFERFPLVEFKETDRWTPTRLSFLEWSIWAVLDEAQSALVAPEPGRSYWDTMRSAEEVIARAAVNFMRRISAIVGQWEGVDLFHAFNGVAALKYEGCDVSGRIVLTKHDAQTPALLPEFLFRFSEPVHLTKTRWARKLLQLGSDPASLIANASAIYGVITNPDVVAMETDRTFSVTFPADRQWTISYRSQPLLTVDAGEAQLPREAISFERFKDQVERLFVASDAVNAEALWTMFQATLRLGRGHMVVIAADAADEAARLSRQGTQVEPVPASDRLLELASRIDGTMLVDVQGRCHAIGVILDGTAQPQCTPSRGARYNSAIRYVSDSTVPRMAIVISDDATLDIVPLLRPRVEAALIERNLAAYETASLKNYYLPRLFLENHRFYLDAAQCERANAAIRRLDAMPREVGLIYIGLSTFEPNPEMNESYLK